MRATGLMIWLMVREDSSKLEEMFMRENGSTTKLKEKESTFIKMAPRTLDSGTTTSNTAMAMRNGQMERSTRETMQRE